MDRVQRAVYVADAVEARGIVRGQWPTEEPSQINAEELNAVIEHVRRGWLSAPLPSTEEMVRQMRERSRQVAALISWLDAWFSNQVK